jgi:hypothetical protein
MVKQKSQDDIGIGSYHKNKAHESRQAIYKVLADGQWHRNMELKKATGLSSRTLAKHLEKVTKLMYVERKEDVKSGQYPVPVFYKANDQFLNDYIKPNQMRKKFSDDIYKMLDESKDPLMILDMIHDFSILDFIKILKEIQIKKKISWEEIDFLEEAFLWYNYKYFTMYLIAATRKIIDKIDIDQLLISQAKRQKEIWNMVMKRYRELGLIKE